MRNKLGIGQAVGRKSKQAGWRIEFHFGCGERRSNVMKINEIYIELGQTRSVNFQSSQNRVGLRASLDDGDDVH